jgi:trimeric autotransporter adhesin
MMPKHSSRAPWGRRFTALMAVSLLTLGACSDSDSGGVGPSSVDVVQIVTVPNGQTLTGLLPGNKRKMLAVPTNSKGNFVDRTVTLASSDPAVFTVTGDTITAVAGGVAYLRATAGGQTDSVAVGVRFRVASVTVTPAAPTVRREGAQQMTATLRDASLPAPGAVVTGRPVNWTSSDTTIATVSATGLVVVKATPVDGSTVTITATATNVADGGVPAVGSTVITINGNAVVSTVSVTAPAGADNAFGFRGASGSVQLTGTALSGLGNTITTPITWSTSAPAVATVSSTGLVTFAGGTGPVNITANATGSGAGGVDVTRVVSFTTAPTLVNGVAQVGAMAAGEGIEFAFSASAVGASSFVATTTGGTGDGDLYVFVPGNTTGTSTDNGGSGFLCRSWNSGNGEICTVNTVVPGWYRLRLHAWSPAGPVAGMQLTVTHP